MDILPLLLIGFFLNVGAEWVETNYGGSVYSLNKYYNGKPQVRLYWSGVDDCAQRNGTHITMLDEEEHTFIFDYWLKEEGAELLKVWLGLTAYQEDAFRWTDGSLPSFNLWAEGMPKDTEDKMCVYEKKGKWININCEAIYAVVVCKTPLKGHPPTTPPPTDTGFCPRGYTQLEGHEDKCFKLVTLDDKTGVTWQEAKQRCRQEDVYMGDLLSVHTSAQRVQLVSHMDERVSGFWIGLFKVTANYQWVWSDNSFTLGVSVDAVYGEDCGKILFESGEAGAIISAPCDYKKGYICQAFKDPKDIISTPEPTMTRLCPPFYEHYRDACYRHLDFEEGWHDANTICEHEGGTLAAIHSKPENAFVQSKVVTKEVSQWIGLSKKQGEDEYEWSNKWYVVFTNWASGNPVTSSIESCVYMDYTGKWTNGDCTMNRRAMCEVEYGEPITTPATVEGYCPPPPPARPDDKWIESGTLCYNVHTLTDEATGTWLESLEKCMLLDRNAVLASIHHQSVNAQLANKAFKEMGYNKELGVWLGLFKGKDGSFRWLDGSQLAYTNWAVGSPDVVSSVKDCVMLVIGDNNEQTWKDVLCDMKLPYICMVDRELLATAPAKVEGDCPSESWDHYGDHCFLFAPNNESQWQTAQNTCGGFSGPSSGLVTIKNKDENNYVRTYLHHYNKLTLHREYWIGLQVKAGGGLQWVDGSKSDDYVNWAYGEPRASKMDDLCVVMDTESGQWSTSICNSHKGYACRAENDKGEEGTSGSAVAGIVFGVLIGIAALSLLTIMTINYIRKREDFRKGLPYTFENLIYFNSSKYTI